MQFGIAPTAVDAIRLPRRRRRELSKSTIAFRTERPALIWSVADIGAEHVSNQDTFADSSIFDVFTDSNDAAATVRSLNSRK